MQFSQGLISQSRGNWLITMPGTSDELQTAWTCFSHFTCLTVSLCREVIAFAGWQRGGSLALYNLNILVLNASSVSRSPLTRLRLNGMAQSSRNCSVSKKHSPTASCENSWSELIHSSLERDRWLNEWIMSCGSLVLSQWTMVLTQMRATNTMNSDNWKDPNYRTSAGTVSLTVLPNDWRCRKALHNYQITDISLIVWLTTATQKSYNSKLSSMWNLNV